MTSGSNLTFILLLLQCLILNFVQSQNLLKNGKFEKPSTFSDPINVFGDLGWKSDGYIIISKGKLRQLSGWPRNAQSLTLVQPYAQNDVYQNPKIGFGVFKITIGYSTYYSRQKANILVTLGKTSLKLDGDPSQGYLSVSKYVYTVKDLLIKFHMESNCHVDIGSIVLTQNDYSGIAGRVIDISSRINNHEFKIPPTEKENVMKNLDGWNSSEVVQIERGTDGKDQVIILDEGQVISQNIKLKTTQYQLKVHYLKYNWVQNGKQVFDVLLNNVVKGTIIQEKNQEKQSVYTLNFQNSESNTVVAIRGKIDFKTYLLGVELIQTGITIEAQDTNSFQSKFGKYSDFWNWWK